MNDQFLADLNQDVGKISQVATLNRKFVEYTSRDIDGEEYIIGKNKNKEALFLEFSDYKLLFSIFKLIKLPLPKYFNKPHLNEVIPLEGIIQWCYKYGLPYEDKALWEKHRCIGFEVNHFRYRVAMLYSRFLLWKAVLDEDQMAIDCNMVLVGLNPTKFTNQDDKINEVKKWLAIYINTSSGGFDLDMEYDTSINKFEFKLRTDSLFGACYYQFATLVLNCNIDYKGNLKQCKCCGSFFWGHGNRGYCDNCDRRTFWSRKHKEKKRG